MTGEARAWGDGGRLRGALVRLCFVLTVGIAAPASAFDVQLDSDTSFQVYDVPTRQ